jgi:hypothetical protein
MKVGVWNPVHIRVRGVKKSNPLSYPVMLMLCDEDEDDI